jgi:hypothetical protein
MIMGKSNLRYWCLLVPFLFVLCSCSLIKPPGIFNQPVGAVLTTGIGGTIFRVNQLGDSSRAFGEDDVLEGAVMKWWGKWFTKGQTSMLVDYDSLGRGLVGLLSESLKAESVDALERLARAWQPLADERSIDREIFVLHKFLLVQACIGVLSAPEVQQSVINKVFAAFYASLDAILVGDIQPPLYVTEYIRSRIGADADALSELEKLWVIRAPQYDEPFALDREEYFENRPGHLPWKRLIVRFMQNFKETPDPLHDILLEAPGSVSASIAVAMTFGEYYENVGKIIISHFGQSS